MAMREMTVRRFAGPEIARYIPDLASLRMAVFREFPYLYAGTQAYEEAYLEKYLHTPAAVMVIAFAGERIVGASTGLPLVDADTEFQAPFAEHGYDLASVFYFGESVLDRAHRGRGIGSRFFDEREAHVRELGRYTTITFCAVERAPTHPRRPANYRPLDPFWQRRGYARHDELRTTYAWQELDENEESPKPMIFWLKRLTEAQKEATPSEASQDKGMKGHKG
jgi:GNAT superfamily N-acetyltransferase